MRTSSTRIRRSRTSRPSSGALVRRRMRVGRRRADGGAHGSHPGSWRRHGDRHRLWRCVAPPERAARSAERRFEPRSEDLTSARRSSGPDLTATVRLADDRAQCRMWLLVRFGRVEPGSPCDLRRVHERRGRHGGIAAGVQAAFTRAASGARDTNAMRPSSERVGASPLAAASSASGSPAAIAEAEGVNVDAREAGGDRLGQYLLQRPARDRLRRPVAGSAPHRAIAPTQVGRMEHRPEEVEVCRLGARRRLGVRPVRQLGGSSRRAGRAARSG